ncbi:MAG: IS200/IS605 family transposase [Bacteroidota bacterium]
MPYIKVYVHFVWSTKNRYPYLNTRALREMVWNHILENGRGKDIFIDFVNGHADHCHCLVSMSMDQPMQKVMQMIKGESAYWINKNQLTTEKFEWQDEYYAVSVGISGLNRVREYIKIQEIRHGKKRRKKTLEALLKKFGFSESSS